MCSTEISVTFLTLVCILPRFGVLISRFPYFDADNLELLFVMYSRLMVWHFQLHPGFVRRQPSGRTPLRPLLSRAGFFPIMPSTVRDIEDP
jgi:hypothetical protein